MKRIPLPEDEIIRRRRVSEGTYMEVSRCLHVQEETDDGLVARYGPYYLQLCFSELHPLMMVCLAREIPGVTAYSRLERLYWLNAESVLGCHSICDKSGCYSYRTTHWLDTKLGAKRFLEFLDQCVAEADRAYNSLVK